MLSIHPPALASPTVSEASRRQLRVVFIAAMLVALASGGAGLWRAAADLDQPCGGFAWSLGYQDLYWVYPTTPHYWPALENGLRHLDVIVSADGQPPSALAQVFSAHSGGEVVYEIQRGGQGLRVAAPVVAFSRGMYWELYGGFLLAGLAALVTAGVLLGMTRERSQVLIACFLLVCGAMLLNQINSPLVRSEHPAGLVANLIRTFGYPLAGAVMWHFTLIFPRPRTILLHWPWLLGAIYALAAVLGALYALAVPPILLTRALEPVIFPLVLAFAASGLVASLAGGALAYRSATLTQDRLASYTVRRLAVAWIVGVAIYAYIGFALHFTTDPMPLLSDTVVAMAILYPLLLIYALLNVQVVEQLLRHLNDEQATRHELSELRLTRDRALHEIADDLHAHVLPDIRGLQMSAEAAVRYAKPLDSQYAAQILDGVYRAARRIMEGIKPVDLQEDQLLPSVERMLEAVTASLPELAVHLELGSWDENFSLAVKEGLFRMLQEATTNVRDYAGARHLTVTLSKDEEYVQATLCDDGHGFDVAQVLRPGKRDGRRHFGLRGMRARAAAMGGQLLIDSGPAGTQIALTLPLSIPPSDAGSA